LKVVIEIYNLINDIGLAVVNTKTLSKFFNYATHERIGTKRILFIRNKIVFIRAFVPIENNQGKNLIHFQAASKREF